MRLFCRSKLHSSLIMHLDKKFCISFPFLVFTIKPVLKKHHQLEKLTEVERVGGSGSGNEDQAWGKKHRPDHRPLFEDPLLCFVLFSSVWRLFRGGPFHCSAWTVSASLCGLCRSLWGVEDEVPPDLLTPPFDYSAFARISRIYVALHWFLLKIAKLFEISSANVKGWSQVENRNRLTDQALSYVGKGFWLLKICFWTFKKELRSIFSGF